MQKDSFRPAGKPLSIVTPRYWVLLVALCLVLASGIAWMVTAKTIETVEGRCVAGTNTSAVRMGSVDQGWIKEWKVNLGDQIKAGQTIATYLDEAGNVKPMKSLFSGRLEYRQLSPGRYVETGDTMGILTQLQSSEDTYETFYIAVSPEQAASLKPGLQVRIYPSDQTESDGYWCAEVESQGRLVFSSQDDALLEWFGIPSIVNWLEEDNPTVTLVRATLKRSEAGSPLWVGLSDPPSLYYGILTNAVIELSEKTIASQILELMGA